MMCSLSVLFCFVFVCFLLCFTFIIALCGVHDSSQWVFSTWPFTCWGLTCKLRYSSLIQFYFTLKAENSLNIAWD